jgi:hypothetical protein
MLIDELKELAAKAAVSGCVVGVWVKNQDKEFQEVMNILMSSPSLNLTEALNLIKKHHPDVPFKRTSFTYHMRGTCTCTTV